MVAVGADRGSDVVVLADPETGRLGYALLSGVVAVELRDPGPFRGGSGPLLGNLAVLLRGLREAVTQVRADDMGRRPWL